MAHPADSAAPTQLTPPHTVASLVCEHLRAPDLSSLRLTSQAWCKAASHAITAAAVVQGGEEELWRQRSACKAVESVLAAFPRCTRIALVSAGGSSNSSTPHDTDEKSCCWSSHSLVMLLADSAPKDSIAAGHGSSWAPSQWRLAVKPHAAAPRASSAAQQQQHHLGGDWHQPPRLPDTAWQVFAWQRVLGVQSVDSLLVGSSEPLNKDKVLDLGRRCPKLTRLHAALEYGIRPSFADGLLGLGVFLNLTQLCLHSSGGHPLRLDPQLDLRLPDLRHLQLSGNITLSFSTAGLLHSSQLTSLTLQQALTDAELQQLLQSQPHLCHLACLAPEPPSTAFEVADCTSSIKRMQRLRTRVALLTDGFDLQPFGQQLLAGEFPLPHSRVVLDHILTPPGLLTPESIAEGLMAAVVQQPASSVAEAASQQPVASCRAPAAPVQRLQHLAVSCGCWADLQALLRLCSPEQLTVRTVPAITDALRLIEDSDYSEEQFSRIAEAVFGGLVPGALRLQLPDAPLGSALRVLVIDTSRTAAGIEVDDRTVLAITASCRQLVSLEITAVLRFGHEGGASLAASLQHLRRLVLIDARWEVVQFLLQLAADAPADEHMVEVRRLMARLLRCCYFGVSASAFLITAVLRKHRFLRAVTLLGLAALALPVTAACAAETVPIQHWYAARLCVSAVKLAQSAPFVVRRCWLPPQLEQLQLKGCVLRCHRRCSSCTAHAAQAGSQQQRQLQVVQEGYDSCSDGSDSGSSSGSRSAARGGLQAAVRQRVIRGQQLGWYPSLFGLCRKVLLAPCVPFLVTVAARAGIVWLLGRRRQGVPARLGGR